MTHWKAAMGEDSELWQQALFMEQRSRKHPMKKMSRGERKSMTSYLNMAERTSPNPYVRALICSKGTTLRHPSSLAPHVTASTRPQVPLASPRPPRTQLCADQASTSCPQSLATKYTNPCKPPQPRPGQRRVATSPARNLRQTSTWIPTSAAWTWASGMGTATDMDMDTVLCVGDLQWPPDNRRPSPCMKERPRVAGTTPSWRPRPR